MYQGSFRFHPLICTEIHSETSNASVPVRRSRFRRTADNKACGVEYVDISSGVDQFFKIACNLQGRTAGTVESFDDSSNLGFEEWLAKALEFIRFELAPGFLEVVFDYGKEITLSNTIAP